MKPRIIVILTVMVSSFIFCQSDSRGSMAPLEVSLVELQRNSLNYDNHLVMTSGEYGLDNERHSITAKDPITGSILVDIWLDLEDDSDVVKESREMGVGDYYRLVTSGELRRRLEDISWIVPLAIKPLPKKDVRAIKAFWKNKYRSPKRITVIGRFDYSSSGRIMLHKNGQTSFTNGFGAGSKWQYRIVVESIVFR